MVKIKLRIPVNMKWTNFCPHQTNNWTHTVGNCSYCSVLLSTVHQIYIS